MGKVSNSVSLRLHAAACRVAHLSGAAKYIENYEREAKDGSSLAFVLERANVLTTSVQSFFELQRGKKVQK
jgi:hypothetical protein